MTTHNVNEGADGPDGIDWDALAAEVRAQVGFPVPADLDADDADDDADAALWPVVLDAKGKPTGEIARPNPQAMRAALDRAAAVDVGDVERLANAVSGAEARQIITQAAQRRDLERALAAEVAERRARLAADGARRQAEHDARMAEDRRRRENRAEAALARRERALDPTGRVVRLAAAERLVPWIAVVPAILAAVLGAVNVGVMLDALSPSTHAINWLVEPLLTLPIVAILAAQILGAVPSGEANPYRRLEWALIAVAVGLNVGLHVAVDGLTPAAAVWAIVPAGLAISAHLVPHLIRHVRAALAEQSEAPAEAFRVGAPAGPVQAETARIAPELSQVNAAAEPEFRSQSDVLADLANAVQAGRIDPGTNRPIDPTSAESIRRTIRVGKDRARALRDEFLRAAARPE